jgi:protein gp37
MADNTSIEWCDHTFNPWEGCQKVSPGCDHCYAETRNARFNGTAVNWGPGAPRRRTSEANWKKPLKWNREAQAFFAAHGRRQRVFCASLADVFDNAVDPQWRRDLFNLILQTPHLDWLLLTKRIGNVSGVIRDQLLHPLPPNVWMGITVVNQEEADRDIPKLLAIDASVRFLSMEPLLGHIDLTRHSSSMVI